MTIELRRVETEEDVDTFLALRQAVDPVYTIGRDAYTEHITAPGRVDLIAWRGSEAVGCAFVERLDWALQAPVAWVSVRVPRQHRRQGVGTVLSRAVSGLARADGRGELMLAARDDDADSLDYWGKRGFVEVHRMHELSLELEPPPALRPPPAGVVLVPFEPELDRAVYAIAAEVEADVPESVELQLGTFEEWRARTLPGYTLRGCSFVALAGDEVAGYATLCDGGDGVALNAMTGVRRAWRGRGVAVALKSAQLVAAAAAGLRRVRTQNAVVNAAMLGVNESLGYRRDVSWLHLRGPLLDGETSS